MTVQYTAAGPNQCQACGRIPSNRSRDLETVQLTEKTSWRLCGLCTKVFHPHMYAIAALVDDIETGASQIEAIDRFRDQAQRLYDWTHRDQAKIDKAYEDQRRLQELEPQLASLRTRNAELEFQVQEQRAAREPEIEELRARAEAAKAELVEHQAETAGLRAELKERIADVVRKYTAYEEDRAQLKRIAGFVQLRWDRIKEVYGEVPAKHKARLEVSPTVVRDIDDMEEGS